MRTVLITEMKMLTIKRPEWTFDHFSDMMNNSKGPKEAREIILGIFVRPYHRGKGIILDNPRVLESKNPEALVY